MKGADTKERIMDSAEKLFAKKGLKNTSVRDITSHADVHLAAVNYHFSSKGGLIRAMMSRRIIPLNNKRIELLKHYESKFTQEPIPVEYTLHALLAPGIKMCFERPHFLRIAGQIISDPDEEIYEILVSHFEDVFSKFKDAFDSSLPHVSEEELMWRIHFLIGAMVHTWTNHSGLESLSGGVCKLNDEEEVINRLIAFCAAGLKAPIYRHESPETG